MKILKSIGVAALGIAGAILLFFAIIWAFMALGRYTKTQEGIRYQKEVCDTIKTGKGNFPIVVNGFNKKELSKIHFYLQQGKLLIRDTTINYTAKDNGETQTLTLPFKQFDVTDRLIINVGKRYYVFSDYRYQAIYNYGMFGPVGPCFCGSNGFEKLNGAPAGSGWLIKKYGLLNYQLPQW
ncbi:hypothetical protein ACFOWA_11715 [Pedobacter lithocola]|uniref:DUF4178 domain-containing protein n=1 Tax=Pedobacter lithocola TaxID=1908239 RepID=A0ABV8PB22_9SPHI